MPTFVFAGSQTSMMEQLYGKGGLMEVQGHPFELTDIPAHLWVEELRAHLREYLGTGISREAVEHIVHASGGHPYRTMLAANRAHADAVAAHTDIDLAVAAGAVERVRRDPRWSLP